MRANKIFNTIITLLIVLFPILNVYSIFSIGFGVGNFLLILFLPYFFVKFLKHNSFRDKRYIWFFAFYLYSIAITFLNIFVNDYSLRDGVTRLLVETYYVILIVMIAGSKSFITTKGIKFYIFFATIASLVILIQAGGYYIFHKNLYFLIPGLTYNQASLSSFTVYKETYDYLFKYWFRPTSVFLEPSHAALYMCPAVFFVLFFSNRKFLGLVIAAVISFSIFLTTSGTGYVLLIIIWISYLLFLNYKYKNKRALFICIFFILFVLILFVLTGTNIGLKISEYLIARLKDIGSGSFSSTNIRLFKGFIFYNNLGFFEKIFGIGCGTYDSYIALNPLNELSFASEYMNSISYILCSTGIIGMVIYFVSIIRIIKDNKNYFSYILLLSLFTMYLTGSTLFGAYDFIYYIFLFSPLINLGYKSINKSANVWRCRTNVNYEIARN